MLFRCEIIRFYAVGFCVLFLELSTRLGIRPQRVFSVYLNVVKENNTKPSVHQIETD